MKRFGNGLRNIGALFCLVLLLLPVSLSAEENLYQVLQNWSIDYEQKLTGLNQKLENLNQTMNDYENSVEKIEKTSSVFEQSFQKQDDILLSQEKKWEKVEQRQESLQKVSTDFVESLASTERSLKQLRLKSDILMYTTIGLGLYIVIDFGMELLKERF